MDGGVVCLTGDLMDRKNICRIEPFIKSPSLHFGRRLIKKIISFSKKSNDTPKSRSKKQTVDMSIWKAQKYNTFGTNTVNFVGRRHKQITPVRSTAPKIWVIGYAMNVFKTSEKCLIGRKKQQKNCSLNIISNDAKFRIFPEYISS